MAATKIVVFDLETAGLAEDAEIIQLSAVAVDGEWNELDVYNCKIQFDASMAEPTALEINHYDKEVWAKEAKARSEVINEFSKFLGKYKCVEMVSKRTGAPYSVALLAGYNAATFDGPRLKRFFGGTFLPAHPRVLCVMQRVLWLAQESPGFRPESFSLGNVAKALGLSSDGAHDALNDVRTTIQVMKAIRSAAVAA